MLELTYAKAVELLEGAVAERGEDYIYTYRCSYVLGALAHDKWQPGCLVGLALINGGVPMEAFMAPYSDKLRDEYNLAGPINGMGQNDALIALVDNGEITIPEEDRERVNKLLRIAQNKQDCGDTWGKALAVAKQYVERPFE